ncbi:hypothetical protein CAI21_09525 [Alkalilimnicola ehrlichii]|uniref:cyclic-guanylate-specific phosphodiesterase n=1 Tax=Alkalilimnicola ehrlichii TaxID=351052 RepID=A0A3E0WV15_9GAMM|nr:EAL domain-containing protein [Alkalilimnicola ehrlichii]RFA29307.1 hypothetical protein CAI21_09525 [Alkalilimnicola ehrlichii]RFA36820.1 hypothetical protein CAL65_09855 [Alkalilimnicola ehrlichii]
MREIAKRSAVAVALPLVGCLFLALVLTLQWGESLQRVQRVEQLTELAIGVSSIISALQDERGATAVALSGVPGFAELVPERREVTDRRLDEAERLFERFRTEYDSGALPLELNMALAALDELSMLRSRADQGAAPSATVEAYTRIIKRLSQVIDAVALDISVPELATQVVSFQRLMTFIEYSARERSLGAVLLGTPGANEADAQTLANNLALQEALLDQLRMSPVGSVDRQLYEIASENPYAIELQAFRERLLDPLQLTMPDEQAAMQWFLLSSRYILELEAILGRGAEELDAAGVRLVNLAVAYYTGLGTGLLALLVALVWVSAILRRRLLWQMEAEQRDAEHIRFLGRHDPLTGLPNRHYFENLLEEEQRATLDAGEIIALHVLDIVDFKKVNRVWGIAAGDAVIRVVAKRLREVLPPDGLLARLYGDQFAIVQPDVSDKADAEGLARRLIEAFAEPVRVEERAISLHIRIGITLYPPNATTYDALMRNADLARQHVVEGGGYTFYVSEMYQGYLASKALMRDLKQATEAGEFQLVYQPKIDLATQRLAGLEALIRWRHPEKGLIGPAAFIAEAERSGMIVPIGAWVFAEACRQLKAWNNAGLRMPTVAVNLSPVQLKQADLVEQFRDTLKRYDIKPAQLELEVTESTFIDDIGASSVTLQQLRDLGVCVAIDDFGTGYSSLTYLQRLPVDRLKLDRSFVTALEASAQTERIVEAIITLSHGLGLRVIAEGVETEQQLTMLRAKGCDEVQGFWFSKPLMADELIAWLKARTSTASDLG